MKTMYPVFTIWMILLLAGCVENTVDPYQPGSIEGYIKLSTDENWDAYSLGNIEVTIRGTDISGVTDIDGYFLILNIPPGTYDLLTWKYIGSHYYSAAMEGVEVEAGEVTLIPEFQFDMATVSIAELIVMDHLYIWYDTRYHVENITGVVEQRVLGAVRGYSFHDPIDTVITVWHNANRVVMDAPKNAFQTSISLTDGLNTIRAEVGDVQSCGAGADSIKMYYSPNQTELYLRLHWKTIDYDSVSAGDLDLYLINQTTSDTCWYRNPNPDWGSQGAYSDDPQLFDRINPYGNNDVVEFMKLDCVPNGDYEIQVHYAQNLDSDTVKVLANVELRLNDEVVEYVWSDPPLELGERWTAASFSVDNSIDKD